MYTDSQHTENTATYLQSSDEYRNGNTEMATQKWQFSSEHIFTKMAIQFKTHLQKYQFSSDSDQYRNGNTEHRNGNSVQILHCRQHTEKINNYIDLFNHRK